MDQMNRIVDRTYRIEFSKRRNVLAGLIRSFTDSKVSHTYIHRFSENEDSVFEATGGHPTYPRSYKEFLDRGSIVIFEYEILLAQITLDQAWRICLERYAGLSYAWLQLPGDAYCEVAEALTGKRPRNPLARKGLVCSELVLLFLLQCNIPGFDHLDRNTVTPQDLLEIIEKDTVHFRRVK